MTRSFIKDTAIMASAPLIIQAMGFLLVPVVARLYTPENFGDFGVFNAVFSTILTLATLDYANAIMVSRTDQEKSALTGLSLSICVVGMATLVILYWINLSAKIVSLALLPWQWICCGLFLYAFHGLYSTLRYRCLNLGFFPAIAGASVAQFLSNNFVVLVWPLFFAASAYGLIVGSLFGAFVQCCFLAGFLLLHVKPPLMSCDFVQMKEVAKRFRHFPFFSVPSNLISRVSIDAPIIILAIFFDQKDVGYYLMTFRLLNMPLSLLSSSIGEVFFSRDSKRPEGDLPLLSRIYSILCLIGILPLLTVSYFGEDVFTFLLGNQWTFSGVLIKYLIFLTILKFIYTPAHFVAVRLGLQKWTFIANLLLALSQLGGMIYGGYVDDLEIGLMAGSVLGGVFWLAYSLAIFSLAGITVHQALKTVGVETILAVLMLSGFSVIDTYFNGVFLVALVIVFSLVFYTTRVFTSKELRKLYIEGYRYLFKN